MAQERVEVRGFPELFRGSEKLAKALDRKGNEAFIRVAKGRAALVAAAMPHRSGRMAASIRGTGSRKALARVGVFKSSAPPYLGWVEFGGTRGRPYIKGGRWIYPIGLAAESELKTAASKSAIDQIRGFPWPKVT